MAKQFRGKKGPKGQRSWKDKDSSSYPKNRNGRSGSEDNKDSGRYDRDPAGRNDLSWYTHNPNLAAAASMFPYPYRPGMELNVGTVEPTSSSGAKPLNFKIPGVLAMDWIPSIGQSYENTDPASILGKEMYAAVRRAYSGRLTVDAPDYVMYVLALDGVYSYIAWLKRIYRILTVWTPENRTLPDVLLGAMGLTMADIVQLRSEKVMLWQNINQLVLMSRKFSVPSSMDLINRHYWMSDNVYTDAPSAASQFYIFNLRAVYKFMELPVDETPGEGQDPVLASGLRLVDLPWYRTTSDVLNASVLFKFGESLIQALVDWDDAYTISGYLERAYEGNPGFIVDEIPQDAIFTPVFNQEVLMQIENSETIPFGTYPAYSSESMAAWSGMDVVQKPTTNAVVCNNTLDIKGPTTDNLGLVKMYNTTAKARLNMRVENPAPADNIIASRLNVLAVSSALASDGLVAISVDSASEIPLAWRYHNDELTLASGNTIAQVWHNYAVPQKMFASSTGLQQATALISALMKFVLPMTQFDWHPLTTVVYYDTTGGVVTTQYGGDVHNITAIGREELGNLHKVCLYSEFNSFGMS